MKSIKKFLAIALSLAMVMSFFAGCTPAESKSPEETGAPSTETPAPATPTPTPGTDELYTWDYTEYETGKLEVSIVINEGVDVHDIKKVKVPDTIDGKTVTKIPHDFFGDKKNGGRNGFGTKASNYEEIECYVESITFPKTIEIVEDNLFWFGLDTIKEIYFKDDKNVKYISGLAFANSNADVEYAKSYGDIRMVINGACIYARPEQEVWITGDTKILASNVFHKGSADDVIESIVVNDGCVEICENALGDAENVKWIYIPATVKTIGGDICSAALKETLVVSAPRDSYALEWAKNNGYKYEEANHGVIYNEGDLFGWEYTLLDDDDTKCSVAIWVPYDFEDNNQIVEVEVPAYINGYKVTNIREDLFGTRSDWDKDGIYEIFTCRRGLCQVHDPEADPWNWTDPNVSVDKVIFPETVEDFEGNTFWFCQGGSISEIEFKSTENIKHIGRYAFHPTDAEVFMADDNGGFFIINGKLIAALAAEEVVFPSDVKETVNCIFGCGLEDYAIVKVIRVNDGCEKLDWGLTEARGMDGLTYLTDIYIPASVNYIDEGAIWWDLYYPEPTVKVHVVEGSYADTFFKTHSYLVTEIVYDFE